MALSSFFSFNKNSQDEGDNKEKESRLAGSGDHSSVSTTKTSLNSSLNSRFPLSVISPPSTTAINTNTSNAYGQTSINGTFASAEGNYHSQFNNSSDAFLSSQLLQAQPPQSGQKDSDYSQQFHQQSLHAAQPAPIGSNAIKILTGVSDIPRGVLKVSIIRAQGLNVTANSKPYVVCTYETAEAITDGPRENEKSETGDGDDSRRGAQPQAIRHRPIYSRQSSNQFLHTSSTNIDASNPKWQHEATFDVVSAGSELEVCVYDGINEAFLGKVTLKPDTLSSKGHMNWYTLQPRNEYEQTRGKIQLQYHFNPISKRHYTPDDFEIIKMLGKGTFGEVFQVKKKDSSRIYAMKVLDKKYIAKKKEIAHTLGERNILIAAKGPFIVPLKFTFQTPVDLYFVFDYMAGGELFFHLQNERKFGEERTKFYIAELVCALEHLHDQGVIYRDLKPENILLDANGHIALCDFGLSKLNLSDDTARTFCGTTEYLAPEILLDENGYNKMVDFWSLGVLIFEMCCGWSPFYADTVQQMYKNIAYGKVKFPKDALSPAGRAFVKGLLNRNPNHRLGSKGDAKELKQHPFFADVDWDLLLHKKIPPPFRPHVVGDLDTSNFDPEFTQNTGSALGNKLRMASTPLSPRFQANFNGFTYVDPSMLDPEPENYVGTYKKSVYKGPGSLIPGNPNLPPDENVIDEDEELNDLMDMDEPQIRSPDVDDFDVELE